MGGSARRMTGPRRESQIAALDVGTSKVAAMIAAVSPDAPPRVLGAGLWECQGVRKGLVANMALTENAIRTAMSQAERNAGLRISKALVSVSAGCVDSDTVSVEVDIAGQKITEADIRLVQEQARARINPGSRTVLHARPALYTIDGLAGVSNPLNFHADRLGVDIHLITADTAPIRNLDECVRSAQMGVEAIVAAPVAAGLAVLAEEERDLGVALIEIGAGVTNIAVYIRGQLVALSSIAMGSADITEDLATYFATSRKYAERLKTFYGAAMASARDNHDMIDIVPISADDGVEASRVPRAAIIAVIRQRLDRLLGEVEARLAEIGFKGSVGRQLVLTGGGAELKGIADYVQGLLGRQVRIGRPRGLVGLPEAQGGCAFATLAGLVHFGAQDIDDIWHGARDDDQGAFEVAGPLRQLFKTLARSF